jgi:hypothetical protein
MTRIGLFIVALALALLMVKAQSTRVDLGTQSRGVPWYVEGRLVGVAPAFEFTTQPPNARPGPGLDFACSQQADRVTCGLYTNTGILQTIDGAQGRFCRASGGPDFYCAVVPEPAALRDGLALIVAFGADADGPAGLDLNSHGAVAVLRDGQATALGIKANRARLVVLNASLGTPPGSWELL